MNFMDAFADELTKTANLVRLIDQRFEKDAQDPTFERIKRETAARKAYNVMTPEQRQKKTLPAVGHAIGGKPGQAVGAGVTTALSAIGKGLRSGARAVPGSGRVPSRPSVVAPKPAPPRSDAPSMAQAMRM